MFKRRKTQQARENIEDWLETHERDYRDPLARPVRLIYEIAKWSASWQGILLRTVPVVVLTLLLVVPIEHLFLSSCKSGVTLENVSWMDRDQMQRFVDSGEAVRLMHCQGDGLEFVESRCHTTKSGGWVTDEPTHKPAKR